MFLRSRCECSLTKLQISVARNRKRRALHGLQSSVSLRESLGRYVDIEISLGLVLGLGLGLKFP